MADPMFLMQRYWGSEEEETSDEDVDGMKSNQNNCAENEPLCKKQKLDNFENLNEGNIKELNNLNNFNKNKPASNKQNINRSKNNDGEISELIISDNADSISAENVNVHENNKNKLKLNKRQKQLKEEIKQENNADNETLDSKIKDLEFKDKSFPILGEIQHEKNTNVQKALPTWLSNPTFVNVNLQEKQTPISELSYLDSNTKNNLQKIGINFLFPVQLAVIPWLMHTNDNYFLFRPSDICVSAPTGSGKTLAFVIPIVQSLKDRIICAIRALVVLPVVELAIQVFKVFQTFTQGTNLKVVLATGQKSLLAEQNSLVKIKNYSVKSLADIVVATPGRVYDHIYKTHGFCLKRLRYLVIDEADRIMEEIQQGWLKLIEDAVYKDCHYSKCVCSFANQKIKKKSHEPSSAFDFGNLTSTYQKLLYSATLTHDPEQLHNLSLYKPKLFTAKISGKNKQDFAGICTIPDELQMLQVVCNEAIKPMVICHLINKFQFKKVLCFTESVERAHRLHLVLEEMKIFQVREISSLNRPVQRKIALQQFSSGKVNILVCSDLVARGMDIEDVDCVISYDIPQFIKIYVHRIGRTARAGKKGTSIALLSEGKVPHFKKLLKSAGIEIPQLLEISPDDLKPYTNYYQSALLSADVKLKEEKPSNATTKKRKLKRKKKV